GVAPGNAAEAACRLEDEIVPVAHGVASLVELAHEASGSRAELNPISARNLCPSRCQVARATMPAWGRPLGRPLQSPAATPPFPAPPPAVPFLLWPDSAKLHIMLADS